MSIAGEIVKLIKKQDDSSSGSMSANMTMMLMQQLNAMNWSLDKQDLQEKKERRKERKRHKKCHRKKWAKKRANKAAHEKLDDHGGKAGQLSNSSSSSNNSKNYTGLTNLTYSNGWCRRKVF
jgi:hypothetical protein